MKFFFKNTKLKIKTPFSVLAIINFDNFFSNFDEYKTYYDKSNKGHNDSLEDIRKSFYQMAFCIEVRKTTVLNDIERDECDEYYDEFIILRV